MSGGGGKILVTGGCGYIGSHACVVLQQAGYQPVVLDNLVNSRPEALSRVGRITGTAPRLIKGDVRDQALLATLLQREKFVAVWHFAGLKAVGQSAADPLHYYDCNVGGALSLCRAMAAAGVTTMVFSSSATVYAEAAVMPLTEESPTEPVNPYGRSKLLVEWLLADLCRADPRWRVACLRYFNPVGAHESGLLGEEPAGEPANLMPLLVEVAAGQRPELLLHGTDYPTPDGTGVRDYLHVMDLAEGHLAAQAWLHDHPGLLTVNLGTGRGCSVRELAAAMARVSGRPIPCRSGPRRSGDLAAYWADPTRAQRLLNWQARRGIEEMCRDSWNFYQKRQALLVNGCENNEDKVGE